MQAPENLEKDTYSFRQDLHESFQQNRIYRVFSHRKPIIMITEKFPESYFLKSF